MERQTFKREQAKGQPSVADRRTQRTPEDLQSTDVCKLEACRLKAGVQSKGLDARELQDRPKHGLLHNQYQLKVGHSCKSPQREWRRGVRRDRPACQSANTLGFLFPLSGFFTSSCKRQSGFAATPGVESTGFPGGSLAGPRVGTMESSKAPVKHQDTLSSHSIL